MSNMMFCNKTFVAFFYPSSYQLHRHKRFRTYQNNTFTALFKSADHDIILLFYAAGHRAVSICLRPYSRADTKLCSATDHCEIK